METFLSLLPHSILPFQQYKWCFWWTPPPSLQAISMDPRFKISKRGRHGVQCLDGPKERIGDMFEKNELTVSFYDTAWVAMVPSPTSPQLPCFPECVTWLLENQLSDGSWYFPHCNNLIIKDALSSTLACIIALKKWNVGEEHVSRGLQFIRSNFSLSDDKDQHTPIGFDIIFPGMIEDATRLGLSLPLSPEAIDALLLKRDLEFKRVSESNSEGSKLYLAYTSEGWGTSDDWKSIMKYQRKNGSLFNSPSTTAAAFVHLQDTNCLNYLHSLVQRFGNAVPTAYPLDISIQLHMVDTLERLGIDRHFRNEIRSVLDKMYRCWLDKDEEIFLDISTCSSAFRILRMHGYDVSADALAQFGEDHLVDTPGGVLPNLRSTLELYRSSEVAISPHESFLKRQNFWTSRFLKQGILKCLGHRDTQYEDIIREVDYALKFPFYSNLERLENKRHVEHFNVDNTRVLKTSYRALNIDNRDFLELAIEDFDLCQTIHRKELQQLERWVKDNRLDKLKFARQKLTYCYFSAAATLFSPELSEARMTWAKNGVLTTVVDDFFDVGGSREELVNLIELFEKWNGISTADFCSDHVEIIFRALQNTIDEIGEKAFAHQGRQVTNHIIEIWLSLLKSMMRETEWVLNKSVPTMDEYITNAYVSMALGPIVLPALYFVGPNLSEEAIRDPEYDNLYKLMSTCGRLLNDMQGFKRERKEGKLNAVSLLMIHDNFVDTEEEATAKIREIIDDCRRELLRLVLKDSVIPRCCKDLFWKMSKVVHLFYMKSDGFTSVQEMVNAVNAVIEEPISSPFVNSSK